VDTPPELLVVVFTDIIVNTGQNNLHNLHYVVQPLTLQPHTLFTVIYLSVCGVLASTFRRKSAYHPRGTMPSRGSYQTSFATMLSSMWGRDKVVLAQLLSLSLLVNKQKNGTRIFDV
jgi:hypothetical protein